MKFAFHSNQSKLCFHYFYRMLFSEVIQKVATFARRGLLESEQKRTMGRGGNAHKNICSKKINNKLQFLPIMKSLIAPQKNLSWYSSHAV